MAKSIPLGLGKRTCDDGGEVRSPQNMGILQEGGQLKRGTAEVRLWPP